MKVQARVLRLDVPLKCRPHGAIDVKMPRLPRCCTFQLLPLIHERLPPFRLASVDRSTSGPVAVHKSLGERCALLHMSALWAAVGGIPPWTP